MNTRRLVFGVEALILGGPITAIALYGVPWLIVLSVSTIAQNPVQGIIGLLQCTAAAWALVEFWRLAVATASNRPHTFGARFWCGVVGAIFTAGWLVTMGPHLWVFVVVGAIVIATIHFAAVQLNAAQHAAPADGPRAARSVRG